MTDDRLPNGINDSPLAAYGVYQGAIYEAAVVRVLLAEQGVPVAVSDVQSWLRGTREPPAEVRQRLQMILLNLPQHLELAKVRLAHSPELHAAMAEAALKADAISKGKFAKQRAKSLGLAPWRVVVYIPEPIRQYLDTFQRVARWKREELVGFLLEQFVFQLDARTKVRAKAESNIQSSVEEVDAMLRPRKATSRLVRAADPSPVKHRGGSRSGVRVTMRPAK